MDRVVAARGPRVQVFQRRSGRFDREPLLAAIIGPTGNLRAPAILAGRTLLVGVNEQAYREHLT